MKLQTAGGVVCEFALDCCSSKLAYKWSHVLGNRPRWARQSQNRDVVHEKAVAALECIGVTSDHLAQIAEAGVVEVVFPDVSEHDLWKAESLPWEHWISAATRDSSIIVVRHLEVSRKATTRKPKNIAFVETAPGMFGDTENFEADRDFVNASLSNLEKVKIPLNPTEEQLVERISNASPDVIHVAGLDGMLGTLLQCGYIKEEMRFHAGVFHGVFFTNTQKKFEIDVRHQIEVEWPKRRLKGKEVDEDTERLKYRAERLVQARDVASHLNSADRKPLLIAFNTWYSNSRLATRCIAEGTGAVLCFHHSMDELVAKLFYQRFYEAFAKSGYDIFAAYVSAMDQVRPVSDQINGSMVVLWSSESLFGRKSSSSKKQLQPTRQSVHDYLASSNTDSPMPTLADPETDRIEDLVGVSTTLPKYLNYSKLHNGRSLLDKLHLWFRFPEIEDDGRQVDAIRRVEVEVLLQVGPESFPYQTQITLGRDIPQIDLADESLSAAGGNPGGGISVPLISELVRKLDESVQSTIYIRVHWQGQTLYRHTNAVTLTPANEWKLDEKDSCWIPSFVQPRAPSVLRIIESAQKYLNCLEDDCCSSFMAYQADDVSTQVQAIWAAIAFDCSLNYVEPPPSNTVESQRLRTPCEVIAEGRGTCADLALLFASCLEWIGIYPVLFMTEKHAFPGYWSCENAHNMFFENLHRTIDEQENFTNAKAGIGTELPWVVGPDGFAAIQELIHPACCSVAGYECAQKLGQPAMRPLEGVFLTKHKGLKEAYGESMQLFCPQSIYRVDPGITNETYGEFRAMIDIKKARQYVTPLPIY